MIVAPQAHIFEPLVSTWWNCLFGKYIERRGIGGGGVSLKVGFEVSQAHALSLPHAYGSDVSAQLLLQSHACPLTARLPSMVAMDSPSGTVRPFPQ